MIRKMMFAAAGSFVLAGVAATGADAAPGNKAAVQVADWTKTVAATPEGGMAMGNPNAKITLVEYGSLTCPHCRHFAEEGLRPLIDGYVRSGKVRFEFRHYILNGYDMAASLLARCDGAKRFFPLAEHFYATQSDWLGTIQAQPKERLESLEGLPPEQLVPKLASLAGLQQVAATQGLAGARANQCLADRAAIDRLIGYAKTAHEQLGVRGTPTFFVNGARVEGGTWAEVEPALKAALGS